MSQDAPQTDKRKNEDVSFNATDYWVLTATISASGMAFIMQSALSPALPAIQANLAASGVQLLWVVNAFQLILSATILMGGSLGDHYGRKRVYMLGIAVFGLASIACGLAPTTEFLIGARAVQGIGGGLMIPGSLAIISAYFPDSKRGKAIGTWSSFTTAASLLAPAVGGFLADVGLWRANFALVAPFALVSLYALYSHVPESRDDESPEGFDVAGTILIAIGLIGINFGLTEFGRTNDFTDTLSWAAIIAGLIATLAFVYVETHSKHPLVPPHLFKSRTFTGVNMMTLFLYGALAGALTFLPLNLIQIQGYSATLAGFAVLPVTILIMVMSPWAGGLIDRIGPRLPLIIGPTIVGFGFAGLALPGVTDGTAQFLYTFLPALLLVGVGMGVTVAPLTTSALGSVPQHNSGVASSVNNLASRAAGVFAVALMGGIGLVTFTGALTADVDALSLPDDARQTIIATSGDLAETTVPDDLSAPQTEAVETTIRWAFVDMFRLLMRIAAGMCWISAALAALLVDETLQPPADAPTKAKPDPEQT